MTTPTPVYPPQPEQPQPVELPATFQPQPPVPLPAYEQPVPQMQQAPAPVQVPEGGYAQRFVTIPLPEFNQPGIECSVRLRNPGMMSQNAFEAMMESVDSLELDENGEPILKDGATSKGVLTGLYAQLLKLIVSWTMWDADGSGEEPELLPSPPTSAEELKRAPGGALRKIMDAVKELQDPQ